MNTKQKLIIPIALVLGPCLAILLLCTTPGVKAPDADQNAPAANDKIPLEYKTEGFVNDDTFRVVVVQPAEFGQDLEQVKKTSRTRAFVSLQKYLMSKNRIVDQNTNAKLLDLIGMHGEIQGQDKSAKTRTVYLFEIKKPKLREYVDRMAPVR